MLFILALVVIIYWIPSLWIVSKIFTQKKLGAFALIYSGIALLFSFVFLWLYFYGNAMGGYSDKFETFIFQVCFLSPFVFSISALIVSVLKKKK